MTEAQTPQVDPHTPSDGTIIQVLSAELNQANDQKMYYMAQAAELRHKLNEAVEELKSLSLSKDEPQDDTPTP